MKLRAFSAILLGLLSIHAFALPDRFHQVDLGLYRGAQPASLDDLRDLKKLGIKTVVNLRKYLKWEEPSYHAAVSELGFGYIHEPLPTVTLPDVDEVHRILQEISNPELQPVFLHCQEGRDRTGMIVALYRVRVQGWKPAAAYAEWRAMGFRLFNLGLLPFFMTETGFLPDEDPIF